MLGPPGKYCGNRLFEWAMGSALLLTGVELVIWPDSIARSKLQFMLDLLGSSRFTVFYLFFGMLRVIALFLNGEGQPWTAYARAIGSLAGAMAWFQMAASLIIAQIALAAPPSPTVPLLLVITVIELLSTFRAGRDARSR